MSDRDEIEEDYFNCRRNAFYLMSDFIDMAMKDLRVCSVALKEAEWNLTQRAIVSIAPIGLSICRSVQLLVENAYIPSAKILVRPLIERVAIAEFVSNESGAAQMWLDGWKRSKNRPSLAMLLSKLERGHPNDYKVFQKFIVDNLNASIHPNPAGDAKFSAPNSLGEDVYWYDKVPNAFQLSDEVCSAVSMAAVFFSSQTKRAFIYKK